MDSGYFHSTDNNLSRSNNENIAQPANLFYQRQPNQQHVSREYAEESPAVFQRRSSFSMDNSDEIDSRLFRSNISELELYYRRLETYAGKWPDYVAVTPQSIAKAGMSYIGPEDKVQCDECKGILYSFDYGDVPIDEHRRHFPLCQFLLNKRYEKLQAELRERDSQEQVELIHSMGSMTTSANNHSELPRMNVQANMEMTNAMGEMPANLDRRKEKITDMTQHAAFHIIIDIGYDEDIVRKAFNILLARESLESINTDLVLDEIFLLEQGITH